MSEQPKPKGTGPEVLPRTLWRVGVAGRALGVPTVRTDLLKARLRARIEVGEERYGEPLKAHNGRDVLRDLEEEILDALHYTAQGELEGVFGKALADAITKNLLDAWDFLTSNAAGARGGGT